MTQSPAPAANRNPSATIPSPRQQRTEPGAEPPRKQAEARSARDRFAARLDRESDSASATSRRDTAAAAPEGDDHAARAGLDQDGSRHGGNGNGDGEWQNDSAVAQLMFATASQGAQAILAVGPGAPLPLDTTMLERMAAQIAEGWPAGGVEAATITFPDMAVAASAHIVRAADGSIAIRIAGLDPRITALQNARLQIELVNALARRRLRIRSLAFEGLAAASQPARGTAVSGADSAIPRVV